MENLLYQRLQVREEVSAIIKRVELHLSYGPPSLVQLSSWNQYLIEKEQDLKEMDGKIEDLVAIDKIAEEIERAETWTNTIVTTRWKLGGVIKDLRFVSKKHDSRTNETKSEPWRRTFVS